MTKKTSLWQRLKNAFSNTKTSPSPPNQPSNKQNPFSEDLTGQVIVDLTQNRSAEVAPLPLDNDTITAEDIDILLASMGYQFTYHPPKDIDKKIDKSLSTIHHFTMQVSDGEREWGCLLRYFENEQLLAVYSIFPFSVPDSHQNEMLAVLAYLNYDLVIGNLELDVQDGEVRFKTSLDLEVTGLTEFVMAYLLQSNFAVTSRLHDTLAEVVAKSAPAMTASEAINNLLTHQQTNSFYLVTDSVH